MSVSRCGTCRVTVPDGFAQHGEGADRKCVRCQSGAKYGCICIKCGRELTRADHDGWPQIALPDPTDLESPSSITRTVCADCCRDIMGGILGTTTLLRATLGTWGEEIVVNLGDTAGGFRFHFNDSTKWLGDPHKVEDCMGSLLLVTIKVQGTNALVTTARPYLPYTHP